MNEFSNVNKFEEFDHTNEVILSEKDLLLKLLSKPKKVFEFIDKYKYDKYVTVLLVLAGISKGFDQATSKSSGDNLPLLGVIGTSIVFGGLFGWISYYIYAALISWMGKWLDGTADTKSVLRVMAYGMFPVTFSLVLIIPQIAVYGNEMFKSDGDIYSSSVVGNIIFYGSALAEVSLAIWSIALCVIGISVTQKFSLFKAILNLFLPVFVFAAMILILILVFRLF